MTSTSASSSSTSSTASATSTGSSSHNRTIGLAVGLGVGIPILITVLVLVWVTIHHSRKLREEDARDKELDFNGDVSFWSPKHLQNAQFDRTDELDDTMSSKMSCRMTSETNLVYPYTRPEKSSSIVGFDDLDTREPRPTGGGSGASSTDGVPPQVPAHSASASIAGSSHAGSSQAGSSQAGSSSSSADASGAEPAGRISHVYTPELMFQHDSHERFSKALDEVYGHNPLYPSTERLRAPSSASLRVSSASSVFGSEYGAGPFATPPRSSFYGTSAYTGSPRGSVAHRRMSNDSMASSTVPSMFGEPITSQSNLVPQNNNSNSASALGQVREAPHPYMDFYGAPNMALDDQRPMSMAEPEVAIESSDEDEQPVGARHVYHQQARDRTSRLSFS